MPITRQHSETEVRELYGKNCEKIIAVVDLDRPTVVYLIYLEVNEIWHRFYLDAGLLFWDEGTSPNKEEDILDDEDYLDLGTQFKFVGKTFSLIKMEERELVIYFDDNTGLQITEKEDESHFKILSN